MKRLVQIHMALEVEDSSLLTLEPVPCRGKEDVREGSEEERLKFLTEYIGQEFLDALNQKDHEAYENICSYAKVKTIDISIPTSR